MKKAVWFLVLGLALVTGLVAGNHFLASPVSAEPSPGVIVELPALNLIGNMTTGVTPWVEVQNLGTRPSKAIMFLWGGYTGTCEPQAPGPFKVECSGLLKPGSAWIWTGPQQGQPGGQIPATARSAFVISVPAERAEVLCNAARTSLTFFGFQAFLARFISIGGYSAPAEAFGSPLAVEVTRTGPGNLTPTARVNAAYSGVADFLPEMVGIYDPVFGGYSYYAPLVYGNFGGFNTFLQIQNSGIECTSIEIWFREQETCLRATIGEVLALAAGETYTFDVSTIIGPGFRGSAWIRSSVPLGIVIDQIGRDVFMSYLAKPAMNQYVFNGEPFFSPGSLVNYGPLIYREFQGWDTMIQVQNLSSIVAAKVKVYFLDQSGDIINTMVDWVCPRGSQTFFLPVINNLPGNWVGTVRIESQEWWSPGDPKVLGPDIESVVQLIQYTNPSRATAEQAIGYNAFPEQQAYHWQIGAGAGGLESGVGLIGIPSLLKAGPQFKVTTELAIQNIVPKPGFTDFAIFVYDQNGLIDFICQKLNEKQVEYINLADYGWINPGFKGSAVISATFWEHDVFSPTGAFVRNLVGLAAVKVERSATTLGIQFPGDEASGSEGFPITTFRGGESAFDFEGPQAPCIVPVIFPTAVAPTATRAPTGTPTKALKRLVLDGTVRDCAGNVPATTVTVCIDNAGPGACVTTNNGNYRIDIPNFAEGLYFVSASGQRYDLDGNGVPDLIELVDVNLDGRIDSNDLFAKNNINQINFVGAANCLRLATAASASAANARP